MRIRQLEQGQTELAQRIDDQNLALERLQEARRRLNVESAQQVTAMVMVASEQLVETNVPAVAMDSNATATVAWHPEWNLALFYAEDFPVLEYGLSYQLWLTRDGERTSGGTFRVDDAGIGSLLIALEGPLDSYEAMGVTVEPWGGSP